MNVRIVARRLRYAPAGQTCLVAFDRAFYIWHVRPPSTCLNCSHPIRQIFQICELRKIIFSGGLSCFYPEIHGFSTPAALLAAFSLPAAAGPLADAAVMNLAAR